MHDCCTMGTTFYHQSNTRVSIISSIARSSLGLIDEILSLSRSLAVSLANSKAAIEYFEKN